MTNKSFLNTEIAWRFPIYQYTIDVSYYETRRASGISYIILELIDKSNNNEKINQTLQSLGISADISYIFCDEFSNMYHYNIIKMIEDFIQSTGMSIILQILRLRNMVKN